MGRKAAARNAIWVIPVGGKDPAAGAVTAALRVWINGKLESGARNRSLNLAMLVQVELS